MCEILFITIVGGVVAGVVIAFVQFFLNRWLRGHLRKRNMIRIFKQMKPSFKCSFCGESEVYEMDISGGFAYCTRCGQIYPKQKKLKKK